METFHFEENNPDALCVLIVADGIEPFLKDFNDDALNYYRPIFDPYKIFKHSVSDSKSSRDIERLFEDEDNFIARNAADNKQYGINLKADKEFYFKNNFGKLKGIKEKKFCPENLESIVHEQEYAHLFTSKVRFGDCRHSFTLYFCVKHENKKKLNSHLWYFAGFCHEISPKYCLLLDAGTEPESSSIYKLYKEFENSEQTAGVCGEIIPQSSDENLFDILGHAQKIEYKFSHILDKSLESLFGYISVLPGAFCAFRFEALQPEDIQGPLWADYFKSIMRPDLMDCYHANIYLAEDRVLCLSLFTCVGKNNLLQYVPDAFAYTDPPADYETLLSQRRRWTNGSWFALIDSIWRWKRILKSKHHWCRKICFCVQTIYSMLNMIYSFVLVGLFYAAMTTGLRSYLGLKLAYSNTKFSIDDLRVETAVHVFIMYGYISLLIIIFMISLGSRIRDSGKAMWIISSVFSGYMALFLMLISYQFQKEYNVNYVYIPSVIVVGSFFIVLVLNHCLFSTLLGIIQLLIMTPTYINIFTMYSICNIHDCSWGNRPTGGREEANNADEFEKFRAKWVVWWAVLNIFVAYTIDTLDRESVINTNLYIYCVGIGQLSIMVFKVLGGIAFIIKHKIKLLRR